MTDIKIYKDADGTETYWAIRADFVDMQTSLYGFGDNPEEALKMLLKKESKKG